MNFSEMMNAVNQVSSAGSAAVNAIQGVTSPALPAPNPATTGADSAAPSYAGKAGIGLAGLVAGYLVLRYLRVIPKII